MDAILLAAGLGKRMAPLSPGVPKPLLPVAGRSLLARSLDSLREAGAKRVVLVVHHGAAAVVKEAQRCSAGLQLAFVDQGEPRGTGHAVAAAAQHVRGDAILAMADALVDPATLRALAAQPGFAVATAEAPDPERYGSLVVQGGKVQTVAEKSPQPPSPTVNTGLYRVPRVALLEARTLRPSPRGELEFTDILGAWAARGEVAAVPAVGWIDVGHPWDLLTAQDALLPRELDRWVGKPQAGTVEPGVQVRGRLRAEAGAVVKSGTYVEGDVWVGPGARVGPNAYLRGPLCIGAGCHVGAATELKASLLMDGACAPHLNYVGDSILGPGVNLGAGTKVANLKVTPGNVRAHGPDGPLDTRRRKFGVVLGPDVKTGINCSLNPGTMVGAGSLLGAGLAVSGWVAPGTRKLG